jgi:superfamily II DNA helicase RecQ
VCRQLQFNELDVAIVDVLRLLQGFYCVLHALVFSYPLASRYKALAIMDLEEALATLKVCSLRGKQRAAIDAILSRRDVLYIFPTGAGKTLVFEVCALCSAGVSIVVSPLLGLLQQQSSKLAAHGVTVLEAWDGKVWQQGSGHVKVIYATAEQLVQQSPLRRHIAANRLSIDRVVVDEAHVVLQWETFRCES